MSNAAELRRIRDTSEGYQEYRQYAAKYFEENGSFKGIEPFTASDGNVYKARPSKNKNKPTNVDTLAVQLSDRGGAGQRRTDQIKANTLTRDEYLEYGRRNGYSQEYSLATFQYAEDARNEKKKKATLDHPYEHTMPPQTETVEHHRNITTAGDQTFNSDKNNRVISREVQRQVGSPLSRQSALQKDFARIEQMPEQQIVRLIQNELDAGRAPKAQKWLKIQQAAATRRAQMMGVIDPKAHLSKLRKRAKLTAKIGLGGLGILGASANAAEAHTRNQIANTTGDPLDQAQAVAATVGAGADYFGAPGEAVSSLSDIFVLKTDEWREAREHPTYGMNDWELKQQHPEGSDTGRNDYALQPEEEVIEPVVIPEPKSKGASRNMFPGNSTFTGSY